MNNQSNKRQQKRTDYINPSTNLEDYMVRDYSKPNFKTFRPSSPDLDYGTFNQFKLDDLINLQSDGFNEPKAIRLAFVQNNAIHLQQQAIEVFQKYVKHELSFIGVYGKSGAGKSLMLDKILNLCQFSGAYFTKVGQKQKGLFMWGVPLSKDNTKVFLLDVDGYEDETQNSYFMLLDLMLFLSSTLIFVAQPTDYDFEELDTITKQVKKEKQKFYTSENTSGYYWPNSVYCMLRKVSISTSDKLLALRKMFNQVNITIIGNAINQKIAKQQSGLQLITAQLKKFGNHKKIISEDYIKCISSVIRDSISKIHVKVEMNLRFTGANLNKLIVNAIQQLNIKNYLNIEKIYKKSMKQLYIDAYNYHTQLYNESLIEFLEEEEPMVYDELIKVFKKSSDQVLESFKSLKVNQELREVYYQKLQAYIAEKQRLILEVNKKKLKNKVKTVAPNLKTKPSPQELCQFIDQAKTVSRNYDLVYVEELTQKLASGMSHFQQTVGKQTRAKQKVDQYSKKLQDKLNQLKNIQNQKKTKSSSIKQTLSTKIQLQNKQKKLNEAINKLKIEVAKERSQNPKKESLKKSKSVEILKLEEIKLLQEKQGKEKIIQELKLKERMKNRQQIEVIQSQITEKVSQQKQLQNILSSNVRIPTIQVLKSTTSLSSPRKVQSRVFNSPNSNIRVISSKI